MTNSGGIHLDVTVTHRQPHRKNNKLCKTLSVPLPDTVKVCGRGPFTPLCPSSLMWRCVTMFGLETRTARALSEAWERSGRPCLTSEVSSPSPDQLSSSADPLQTIIQAEILRRPLQTIIQAEVHRGPLQTIIQAEMSRSMPGIGTQGLDWSRYDSTSGDL